MGPTTWIFTQGQSIGYRKSELVAGVWFVYTLDVESVIGQVELGTESATYVALEYPDAEAAAEGASEYPIGTASSLREAVALFAY